MTTWHRITRSDWYANGIDSHDETDCSDAATCSGEVIAPGHFRYDLRETWMRSEVERRAATTESRCEALHSLATEAARIESALASTVDDARMAGVSWAAIGGALGMTKQGAQQRFSRALA